jgi:hypothetical protein
MLSGYTLIPKTQGKLTLCFSFLITAHRTSLPQKENDQEETSPLYIFLRRDSFDVILLYICFANLLCESYKFNDKFTHVSTKNMI